MVELAYIADEWLMDVASVRPTIQSAMQRLRFGEPAEKLAGRAAPPQDPDRATNQSVLSPCTATTTDHRDGCVATTHTLYASYVACDCVQPSAWFGRRLTGFAQDHDARSMVSKLVAFMFNKIVCDGFPEC